MVAGFQRGSKQMGVPTANVAPTQVEHHFEERPKGVYFGWAQLQPPASGNAGSSAHVGVVAPMVLNYGVRPTMKDGSHATVRSICTINRGCSVVSCLACAALHAWPKSGPLSSGSSTNTWSSGSATQVQ